MNNFIAKILGNVIRWIYDYLVNNYVEPGSISFYAISIIIMTFIVTLITIPMTISQQKQSEKMASLGPEMEALQKKYSYDPQVLQQQTAKLYKEKGVNTMGSSCLFMIIQLIILMGLLNVIRQPEVYFIKEGLSNIKTNFLRVDTLAKPDPLRYGLPLLTSLFQALEQLFNMKINPQSTNNPQTDQMNKMFLLMPIIYYFPFRAMPAGMGLYRTVSSIFRLLIRIIMHLCRKK